MWQHRNQRPGPATTHGGGRQSTSSVIRGGCFEQQLAARHMMLHWLATQQATAAVDTGRQCIRPSKPVKQAACKAEAHERRRGKQPCTSAPVIAARLSDLLSRCRPMVVTHAADGRSSAAHGAQSRLAQMPWCYQGPLRHAEPTSPETTQDDQPDPDEGDDSGTLERGAPYLDFLASLTENLVLQPALSDDCVKGRSISSAVKAFSFHAIHGYPCRALHGACEKYIAREASGLDQEVLWNLVWELFPELYQLKRPAC